jgi:hypothetical protein
MYYLASPYTFHQLDFIGCSCSIFWFWGPGFYANEEKRELFLCILGASTYIDCLLSSPLLFFLSLSLSLLFWE